LSRVHASAHMWFFGSPITFFCLYFPEFCAIF
jgi:hypothetical protein